jgi:glycosyltransferase involved in cell wall biosynthesis
MRLIYIAYPTSLALRSANAIQTYTTLRELHRLAPETLALVPRWFGEPTRFGEVGARHLPRPAIGKLSRFYRTTLLYYAERSVFAAMTAAVVAAELARGHPADVIYVREAICAGWWAALWGPLLQRPVIYEAHDLESWNPSRAREGWAQPLLNLLDRLALTRSAAVVSLTDDFRRLLDQLGWRRPAEVAVIPDAFDEERFAPGDRAVARRRLGIPETAPLLAYAGMTFAYRGIDRLLEAFVHVRSRIPSARLALVGGRPGEIDALRSQAARLGLNGAVIWTGQIDQAAVLAYLHAADVLIVPDTVTDVTASPLKLFEYLATGRAVVLPDIPALAEVLPRSIGYYFRRGDSAALAAAIHTALDDPRRAEREQAGRAAVAPHTYAARATQILALARSIASHG